MWAAWRVSTAGGLVPVLSAFLVVLTGYSVHDLVHGLTTIDRVATHGLLVLGLLALVLVYRSRSHPRPGSPAGGADGPTRMSFPDDDAVTDLAENDHSGATALRRAS